MWKFPLLMMVLFNTAMAQTANRTVVLLHYALDSFSHGKVLLKNGTSSLQVLNYNTLTGEMIFASNNRYLAIASPEDVDTVYIAHHKFVPVANKFCEWLGGSQPALLKEYTCTIKEPEAEAGYGKTSTTATTALKSLIHSGGAYNLTLPSDFELVPGTTFYLRSKGKFYKLTSAQQAAKLFPAKKQRIEEWIKTHPSKFTNEEEMVRFVQAIQD
ncbi:MAG: hypothetical protein M3Q06_09195 [Bacteroidota bacterium]|nr:hypothetical protein [Bacteroidota bacterium]